jgi:hypothetical protein
MAAQPQALLIQQVTSLLDSELVPKEANLVPSSNDVYVTIRLLLPGAIGQLHCPTPQAAGHSLALGVVNMSSKADHAIADTSDTGKQGSGKQEKPRFSRLEKIAVFAGLLLIIPPFAILFGVNAMHCYLAWFWLCISFILVFTVLLFLNGRISRSDFAKLWKSSLGLLGRHAKPPANCD